MKQLKNFLTELFTSERENITSVCESRFSMFESKLQNLIDKMNTNKSFEQEVSTIFCFIGMLSPKPNLLLYSLYYTEDCNKFAVPISSL